MTFYSGTPGSGKSLHVAREIYNYLTFYKKNIITNIYINLDKVQGIKRDKKGNIKKIKHKSIGNYIYKNIHELSVEYLIAYSEHYHKHGKEGQTILIIDEAQTRFNPRMNPIDRLSWVHFFVEHRHLGFDVIVISPNLRLIDLQIRYNFEYEVQLCQTNQVIAPDIDTVFLSTKPEHNFISSSIVKELSSYKTDISKFVPEPVYNYLNSKK